MRPGYSSTYIMARGRCAVCSKVTDIWSGCSSIYIMAGGGAQYVQNLLISGQGVEVYI